ncbi:MAG: hypothetical protein LBH75_07715 [Treponema sp.]|nr:hypothetical protein [Treponema sp.]
MKSSIRRSLCQTLFALAIERLTYFVQYGANTLHNTVQADGGAAVKDRDT